MRGALRDAGLSALVALGLFGPMIGLRTDSNEQALFLTTRPAALAAAVGAVFAGRLLFLLWRARRTRADVQSTRRLGDAFKRSGRYLAPALLAVAVLMPLLGQRYFMDIGVVVLTYVMLGWGLNIVVGLAGLLDLGYVAFYAVGAYAYALLSTTYGLGF